MQAPVVKTDQAGPPIEDLKLGQLIVKTRKGRLFRGSYQRQPAAIKVTHLLPMCKPLHIHSRIHSFCFEVIGASQGQ